MDQEGDQGVDHWDGGGCWWGDPNISVIITPCFGNLLDGYSDQSTQGGMAHTGIAAVIVEDSNKVFGGGDLAPCSDCIWVQPDQEFPDE